jgi:hypothetical protein
MLLFHSMADTFSSLWQYTDTAAAFSYEASAFEAIGFLAEVFSLHLCGG